MSRLYFFVQYIVMSLEGLSTGVMFELLLGRTSPACRTSKASVRIFSFFLLALLICFPSFLFQKKILPFLNLIAYFFGTVFLLMHFYGTSRRHACFLFCCYLMMTFAAEITWMMLYPGNSYTPVDWTRDPGIGYFLTGQLTVLAVKLFFLIMVSLGRKQKILSDPYLSVCLVFLVLFALSVPTVRACITGTTDTAFPAEERFNITIYLLAVFCSSALVFLARKQSAAVRMAQLESTELLQQSFQEEAESRKHHLLQMQAGFREDADLLQTLLKNGKTGQAREKLAELTGASSESETGKYCAHGAANAVIVRKTQICLQENIRCEIDAEIPAGISINRLDVCIVLGNLLDNAIQACRRLEKERWIWMKVRRIQEQLVVVCRNACPENPQKEIYGTGLGQKILAGLAEVYGGSFTAERCVEAGEFVYEAMLVLPDRFRIGEQDEKGEMV